MLVIIIKSISLCVIVKDEEKMIGKLLESVKDVVDEIIIVDTGSKDTTIKICEEYTHKIYNFKWVDDFSKARNYSLNKATCDYILWLDADDYLTLEEIEKLKLLKVELDGTIDVYYFLYKFQKDYEPFYRERLIKNNGKYYFVGKVHEAIIVSGNIKYENIVITQQEKPIINLSRNLKIYENMNINEFKERDFYYYGKELFRNKKFNKSKRLLKKFLSFKNIYNEYAIDACFILSNIFIITSNNIDALKYLFLTFIYDTPRANVLCNIGDIYYMEKQIDKAIYYYELALKCKNNNKCFIPKDYFGYYPSLKLCLCYDLIQNYKKANEYNELANTFKNVPSIYQYNKQYLIAKLK